MPIRPLISHAAKSLSLPLLAKELLELSARPRTYLIRALYAVGLLVIGLGVLDSHLPRNSSSPLNMLGAGSKILANLGFVQTYGLLLVLPVLACGTLTTEKERQTLDLLLITKLGPGTIILEKFLSQLIQALNFVLISSPILAFCYSLGGVDVNDLVAHLLSLVLTAIQLTAIGTMCSACFRTTAQALVVTYSCIGLIILIADAFLHFEIFLGFSSNLNRVITDIGRWNLKVEFDLSTPAALLSTIVSVVLFSGPSLLISATCLLIGRKFLQVARYREVIESFNKELAGTTSRKRKSARRFFREEFDVPNDNPISWREGPPGFELREWWKSAGCATSLLTGFLLAMTFSATPWFAIPFLNIISFLSWFVLTLWICIAGSSLIIRERTEQTLDVLLTTPMTSVDIVDQKMLSVRRIIWLGRLGLAGCAFCHLVVNWDVSYLINSAIMIWLYPELCIWQALVCGLSTKNSSWAILKTILLIAARCIVPLFLAATLAPSFQVNTFYESDFLAFLACFSPLTLLAMADQFVNNNRISHLIFTVPFVTLVVNGLSLVYLERKARSIGRRVLGRMSEQKS